MPAVPLAIGFPPGVAPGSATLKVVPATNTQSGVGSGADWIVPGGEAWLVHTLEGQYQTGGAAAGRLPSVQIYDQDGTQLYGAGANAAVAASAHCTLSAGLSIDTGGIALLVGGGGPGAVQLPLPWMILLPGWQISFFVNQASAADFFFGGNGLTSDPLAIVSAWDLGGAGGGTLDDLIPGYTADELVAA